ncbi:uncharacterized protein LOC116917044 [Daphnia magna]|uniref:uncharacterized protein LOC116917044 n=1 Tax=Daphnia magna TaxID=35525 RepID=UPI001E1BABAC|nr:uncharacterized protein LOC116917044 [Daphnia magna]
MKDPDGVSSNRPSAIKTRSNSGAGLGGVEAIFLSSADADEEGTGGEKTSIVTQELWRQKHAQQEEEAQRTKKDLSWKKDQQKQQWADASQKQDQPRAKDDKRVSNKQAAEQRTPGESTSSGKRTKQKHQQKHADAEEVEADRQPPSASGRNSLRKTRSVTDVDGERESQVSSAASSAAARHGGRRMSISVASAHHQYSMGSSSRDSSRRSSAASIVISVSRPDSPLPHLIQRIGEESLSIEFLRFRRTATAVHSASKFRHPHIVVVQAADGTANVKMSGQETAANLIRMHKERRNSVPTVPRLDLKEENEKDKGKHKKNKDGSLATSNKRLADGQQSRRNRRRRSSTGSSIQGFYMPASRPSSAMAADAATFDPAASRPSSAATIVQLGKLSRPWTPARSPSPVSGAGSANRYGAGSRNLFRSRTPTSMATPLQALNTKVNNILGCASNILDFYQLRPDIKKEPDQHRQNRLLKSMKMNEAAKADDKKEETAQSRLIKFRKKAGQQADNQRDAKLVVKSAGHQPVARAAPAETSKRNQKQQANAQKAASKADGREKVVAPQTGKATQEPEVDEQRTKQEKSQRHQKASDKDVSKSDTKLPMLPPSMTATQKAFNSLSLKMSKHKKTAPPGNLSVTAGGGSCVSLNSAVSSHSSGTNPQTKAMPLLKSMMEKQKAKTTIVAAVAFSAKSSTSSMTKFKIKKVMKMAKTAGLVARRKPINTSSHNQSTPNNASGQGPPTLVNFFKRSNRTNNADSRVPIKYETFTDKDRAAAVLLGDADIKTTLEKQLKSERGRYVLPKESPAQVYLAQADFEMRIGGLATAKNLLNKALELQPGDKNALCSRSRCRLQMGDTKGALDDAEEALTNDSSYVRATYQKAEVLYQMGRFEEALVFYHKGCKQRPDMELFHQGVRKAQEAIEISLGVKPPTLHQQQQYRSTTSSSKRNTTWAKGSSSRLPPLGKNSMAGGHQMNQFSQQLEQRLWPAGQGTHRDSSLLGDLHVDKIYLERLLENPGLHNQSASSLKIIHHAKETLEYLKGRENFWKQQQPFHIVYTKERTNIKTHHRRRRRIPSSNDNTTSTEDSTSDTKQSGDASSSRDSGGGGSSSGNCTSRLAEEESSSSGASTEREEPPNARCSSDEVSRILAVAAEEDENECCDGNEDLEEWRQVVDDMTECIEKRQIGQCADIFLAKCCGWATRDEDLIGEIEAKMSLLRLHGQQQSQCKDDGNTNEKMHLAIEIAVLYLADGQQELSKTCAQQGLALAERTADVGALLQLWLLMAALEATSGNWDNVETCLIKARRIFNGETEENETESQNPGEVVNPGEGLSCN